MWRHESSYRDRPYPLDDPPRRTRVITASTTDVALALVIAALGGSAVQAFRVRLDRRAAGPRRGHACTAASGRCCGDGQTARRC